MKMIISPARLGEGGAAILAIEKKNHHKVIRGAIEIILRIRTRDRVPVRI
jgi:hypothetical protein